MSFHVPEQYRLHDGPMASDFTDGNQGAFIVPSIIAGRTLVIIASCGADWQEANLPGEPWEHVSVHVNIRKETRTPTWDEMCYAKSLFWDDDDLVIQFHPRKSEYVNVHSHTLHMWRPTKTEIPTPPILTV